MTFIILLNVFFFSCKNYYTLNSNEKRLIPYLGNERLYFTSEIGVDTIQLDGYSDEDIYDSKESTNYQKYYQSQYILHGSILHNIQKQINTKGRYYFIYLTKIKNDLYLALNFHWNRLGSFVVKLDLNTLHKKAMEVNHVFYNDVIEIEATKTDKDYGDNSLKKVYWSISKGLLSYVTVSNVHFVLSGLKIIN